MGIENIVMMIDQADTVDAVEVIRCKDCKHWDMVRVEVDERIMTHSLEVSNDE